MTQQRLKRRKLDSPSENEGGLPEAKSEQDLSHSLEQGNALDTLMARNMEPKVMIAAEHHNLYSGDAFRSSFFKLQVEEMLSGARRNHAKCMTTLDDTLRKLKSIIESIQSQGPLSVRTFVFLLHRFLLIVPTRSLKHQSSCKNRTRL
jgi:U3 small nucleolar RNA-associated protein 22